MTNTVLEGTGQITEGQQYVTFNLNKEEYAVDAINVQEIMELVNITKVPHLPEYLKGVINLRGTIIPVIDLKLKFGMAAESSQKHICVIVVEFSGGVMGLIVDSVSDVLHIPENAIASTPSFGAKIRTDFIRGMGKVNDRLVLVLNIDRVLTDEEAAVLTDIPEEELISDQ